MMLDFGRTKDTSRPKIEILFLRILKYLDTEEYTYSHLGYSHNPHIITYLKKKLVSTLNTLRNIVLFIVKKIKVDF